MKRPMGWQCRGTHQPFTKPFLFMERARQAPSLPQTMSMVDLQRRQYVPLAASSTLSPRRWRSIRWAPTSSFWRLTPTVSWRRGCGRYMAVRREAIIWRDTLNVRTREAYWSYLQRYPMGAHAADAAATLTALAPGRAAADICAHGAWRGEPRDRTKSSLSASRAGICGTRFRAAAAHSSVLPSPAAARVFR